MKLIKLSFSALLLACFIFSNPALATGSSWGNSHYDSDKSSHDNTGHTSKSYSSYNDWSYKSKGHGSNSHKSKNYSGWGYASNGHNSHINDWGNKPKHHSNGGHGGGYCSNGGHDSDSGSGHDSDNDSGHDSDSDSGHDSDSDTCNAPDDSDSDASDSDSDSGHDSDSDSGHKYKKGHGSKHHSYSGYGHKSKKGYGDWGHKSKKGHGSHSGHHGGYGHDSDSDSDSSHDSDSDSDSSHDSDSDSDSSHDSDSDSDDGCTGPDCGCDGKVNYLKLRYDGAYSSTIVVTQHDGTVVFSDVVELGDEIELVGADSKGTLGAKVNLSRDGTDIEIHTSCSVAIGPGTLLVDSVASDANDEAYAFVVLEGSSRNIDTLCDTGDIPPPPTPSLPPIVDAGPDITITDGDIVVYSILPGLTTIGRDPAGPFERTATASDPDGIIVTIEWTYTSQPADLRGLVSDGLTVGPTTVTACDLLDPRTKPPVDANTCTIEEYTVTVTDNDGNTATDSFLVTVLPSGGGGD